MSGAASVKTRKGIFPGYSLLGSGFIMCLWSIGIYFWGFGQYVKPLIAEFGWTRAQVSLAHSFGRLEGGLEGPFGGIAIDKWGPKVINLCGIIMLGVGLSLMYFVNSLWQFYVIWIMTSLGANLGLVDCLDAAMANWFVKRRGLMIGLMRVGIAGSGLMVAFLSFLLYQFGWRLAFPMLGGGTLLIGIPLTLFFVKSRRPEYYGWLPDGKRVGEEVATDTEATIKAGVDYATESTGEVEFTVRQALRDRAWWICVIGLSLRGMVLSAVTVHTIPLLTDLGMDPIVAGVAMGSMVLLTAPGRVGMGWLGDRVTIGQLRYLVMLGHFLEAVGLFILTRATSMTWLWVYIVVYGLGSGSAIGIWPALRGRYWGRKAFASIMGAMAPFTMITGVIAPVYAGWIYDTTGSYRNAFNILLIFLITSVVVMFFAKPPKPPKKIGSITEIV